MRPLHILFAEDVDINQQLVTTLLAGEGHRVALAGDGSQAIALVDQAAADGWMYDLILMDLQMPNVDGLMATRAIRGRGHGPAELPIIALTANAFPDDVAACLHAGMQTHLSKPVSRPALAAALSKWANSGGGTCSPPIADVEAEPEPEPEPGSGFEIDARLRELYAGRKASVLAQLARMINDRCYDDVAARALAAELHKLAGVAQMFGEPEVGTLTARLERHLLEWSAEERRLRVADAAATLRTASARSN